VRWTAEGGAGGAGGAGGRPPRPADAEAAKAAGNTAFAAGCVAELRRAVWHYTDALLLGHADAAAIESNRSAAHAKLGQFHAALEDADAAVARRPDWAKAHGRRGAALHGLREWARSESAYLEGLTHEPDSAQLQQGLEEARKAAAQ
jgi:stress-induced-phosphoprotein 1